jgi:hypothetical protein
LGIEKPRLHAQETGGAASNLRDSTLQTSETGSGAQNLPGSFKLKWDKWQRSTLFFIEIKGVSFQLLDAHKRVNCFSFWKFDRVYDALQDRNLLNFVGFAPSLRLEVDVRPHTGPWKG